MFIYFLHIHKTDETNKQQFDLFLKTTRIFIFLSIVNLNHIVLSIILTTFYDCVVRLLYLYHEDHVEQFNSNVITLKA